MNGSGAANPTPKPLASRIFAIRSRSWMTAAGWRAVCAANGFFVSRPAGKHSVLFATAGASVTVVDLSPAMLELDRRMAKERGLAVRVVESSMEDLSMFPAAGFDVVIQPVSTCYVPDIVAVYRQVARVTAVGGLYISQHKQPATLQAEVLPSARGYTLSEPYYRTGPLRPVMEGASIARRARLSFCIAGRS